MSALVRSIFAQPDQASVFTQHAQVLEQFGGRLPEATAVLSKQHDELHVARHYGSRKSLASAHTTLVDGEEDEIEKEVF